VAVAGLALAAAACGSDATNTEGASASAAAPFTADRLGGGELASSSFSGQDTVLWFWAPWCTTCRAEAPNVVAAAEALDGQVEVIGVAGRGEVPEMEDFVDETGTGGLTHVVDPDGSIWADFGVASQPAFAFIDDDGSVEMVIGAMGETAFTQRMTELAAA